MRIEIRLNGRLEDGGNFGAQDYRLSLSGDELCLEIVGADMELFIEANDLIEAIAQLKMGGDDLQAMVHEAVRRHLEYLREGEVESVEYVAKDLDQYKGLVEQCMDRVHALELCAEHYEARLEEITEADLASEPTEIEAVALYGGEQ